MGGVFKKIGGAIGGALGLRKSSGQRGYEHALGLYNDISAPNLQQLALQGVGPSQFDSLSQDPNSLAAQDASLAGLTELANQQGLSASDVARLKQVQQQQALANRGQQEAIGANARMRGLASSGLNLASRLLGQQNTANMAQQAGTDVLAGADQRRLQALGSLGSLGTGIAESRFGIGAKKASAADEIARYNNQISNQNRAYNTVNLPQQQFENQLTLARDKGNLYIGGGKAGSEQENRMLKTAGTIGSFFLSDQTMKTNIDSSGKDVGKFLDTISASSWDYKDEKHGKGKHAGPMAQELEATELGKSAVIETPIGKMVHSGKAAALALAGTKVLHERLKKLEKK